MRPVIFILISLFSISLWSHDMSGLVEDKAPENLSELLKKEEPLLVEGVYQAEGPMKGTGSETGEKISVIVSIMQSVRTGQMNLTVSSRKFRNILFFASQVMYQRSQSDFIEVESFGVNFRGARQHMIFKVFPSTGEIEGLISANFFENAAAFEIKGKKEPSTYEEYLLSGERDCAEPNAYLGVYQGQFIAGRSAQLSIHEIPTSTGGTVLAANISNQIQHLFHDGFYNESNQRFVFGNEISYPMRGLARKLVLFCDQDDDDLILRGLHIASTGVIVREIEFRKKK